MKESTEELTQADLEYACSNDVQTACLQAGALRLGRLVPRMAKEILAGRTAAQCPSREGFLITFREAHAALHRLWTDAVDKGNYNKAEWETIDNALSQFELRAPTEAAECYGIRQQEPLP